MTQKNTTSGRPQSILKSVPTENKPSGQAGCCSDHYRVREPVPSLLLSSASLLASSSTSAVTTSHLTQALKSRKHTTLIKFVNILTFFAWLTATTAALIVVFSFSTNFWLEIIEHFDNSAAQHSSSSSSSSSSSTAASPYSTDVFNNYNRQPHHDTNKHQMTRIIVSGLWSICFINKYSIHKSIYFFLSAASLQLIGYLLLTIGNCCKTQKIFVFFAGIAFIKCGLVMLFGLIVYISQLKQELDDFDTTFVPSMPQQSTITQSATSPSSLSTFSLLFLVLSNSNSRTGGGSGGSSVGGGGGVGSGNGAVGKLQSYRYGSSFLAYVLGFIAVELSGSSGGGGNSGNSSRLSSLFPPPPSHSQSSLPPHYHFNGCNYLNSLQNIRNQSYNSQIKGPTSSCTIHGSLKYPHRTPNYQFENQNLHRDITTNTISSSMMMAEEEFSGGGGGGCDGTDGGNDSCGGESSTENITNSDKQTQSCASATSPNIDLVPKEFITFNLNNTLNRNMRLNSNTIARRTTPV